jgi:CIC family chloride channel protein
MRALFGDVNFALGTLLAMFAVRFVISMTSYGCGAPGGLFAPLLVLGALHGFVFAHLTGLDAQACAVVGMAAYFTAIVRAPLTGVVLITEMTLNYNLMLPLLLACAAASMVCELAKSPPIYDALEERDTVAIDLLVREGAPWVGIRFEDLDLPEGVESEDEVLRAGSKIIVSMSATRDEALLSQIRAGCGFSNLSEPAATVDGTHSSVS